MPWLAYILDPSTTGGLHEVPGEIIGVMPDHWAPSKIEAAEFGFVFVTDQSLHDAAEFWCRDGVPDAARKAEADEVARFRADCDAARLACAKDADDARVSAEAEVAQKIDLGFPFPDVLTDGEKTLLLASEKRARTIKRVGIAAAEAVVADALSAVAPIDPAVVTQGKYPARVRVFDFAAHDGKPLTRLQAEALCIEKKVG